MKTGFLALMAMGDQLTQDIVTEIEQTAVTSMLKQGYGGIRARAEM